MATPRRLAVFDFDHTVVDDNTDTVVRDLLDAELTAPLRSMVKSTGWTAYMAEVFRLLYANNITEAQIREVIRNIPEVPGFVRLIKRLIEFHHMDVIICSDSNTVFISEWLQHQGLNVLEVLTNHAHFTEAGLLSIQPFHQQTSCDLCPSNLCKGLALREFVAQRAASGITYDRIVYTGDGCNDICPVRGLNENGIACARYGYAMQKKLAADKGQLNVKAKRIIFWDNGDDLAEALDEALQSGVENGGGQKG